MRRTTTLAVAALVLLAGCGTSEGGTAGDDVGASASPAAGASTTSATPSPATTDGTGTGTGTGTATATADPAAGQGSPQDPALAPATQARLDWQPLPGRVVDTVTTNGRFTLTLDESGGSATLAGPGGTRRFTAGPQRSFGDGLLDDGWAVLVAQDRREQAPAVATVVDLAHGGTWRLDGSSAVPTTTGGAWTLAGDRLLHPTVQQGAYCLAEVDLGARGGDARVGYCAPPRSGFTSPILTDAGTGLLTFDDHRPSCRTAVSLHGADGADGADAVPLPGVADCTAWQGLPTADGAVWSVIPQERRIEHAAYYAHTAAGWFDLGPGTSGTLVWCAGSAFFSRDPDGAADPAALMRWDGARLTVAYTAPQGQSFVAEPRCAGSRINLSVLAEGGDEQVSAVVD